MQTKLKIAIQKKGRLSEDSLRLIKSCGISIKKNAGGMLKTEASNFPLEILFLRNGDIPKYVEDGVADIGIIGENVMIEKQKDVRNVQLLGFSKCRLSLAIKREENYPGLSYFQGKSIATSYPIILGKFLKENNIQAQIEEISGSVEIAPGIGLAEGICDIVSTGSTLLSNGLKEVETVMKSQAVMIATQQLSSEKQNLLDKLLFRINATQTAKKNKYILLNAPNEKIEAIIDILPGMKSPTVVPLYNEGWSSIHSVINEDDFWGIIDKLREAGAQGILVSPIEKMIV